MRPRHLIALLVALALASLAALGHASPADPSWIGGVYDGADFDDVVLIATSTDLALDGGGLEAPRPLWQGLGVVDGPAPPAPRSAAPAVVRGRAPPAGQPPPSRAAG